MSDIEVGTKVCAVGHGSDAREHLHGVVSRLTKTMIIVTSQPRGNTYRFSRTWMQSVPRSDWGGLTLATTCQRQRESK